MKKNHIFLTILIAGSLVASCKKDTGISTNIASLNIINATVDAPSLALNFSSVVIPYYRNKTAISMGSAVEFGLSSGVSALNLVSSADTSNTLFHGTLDLKLGGIYSLYVIGQTPHMDTLFMKDNIPAHEDSTAGARFINLSPDSQSLSINQVGNTTPDFTSLAYKKITGFKKYSAVTNITNNGGYTYEIRDESGNILTIFNWNPAVFKNNTLVITGLVGNSTVSVFSVNNY